MSRLPHQIMSKKGDGNVNQLPWYLHFNDRINHVSIVTRDEGFIQLENRFNETTKMADLLKAEAQAFRDSVSGQIIS